MTTIYEVVGKYMMEESDVRFLLEHREELEMPKENGQNIIGQITSLFSDNVTELQTGKMTEVMNMEEDMESAILRYAGRSWIAVQEGNLGVIIKIG